MYQSGGVRMESTLNFIAHCAVKSLLYEVSASPKPGLVDRFGTGAHKDMDYFTFLDSALVLKDMFYDCAKAGYEFEGDSAQVLFQQLRPIGIMGERRMLQATGGVNTHKGAIFSLGILCAAGGMLKKRGYESIPVSILSDTVKAMTRGVTGELKAPKGQRRTKKTSGERQYDEHGVLGIRGEVERGFPSVMEHGLPMLEAELMGGVLNKNDCMLQVLLNLLIHVDDTNVLARFGLEGIEIVRSMTRKALSLGGMHTEEGRAEVHKMDEVFVEKNISPGGTADLLAVTLMFHFLEQNDTVCLGLKGQHQYE